MDLRPKVVIACNAPAFLSLVFIASCFAQMAPEPPAFSCGCSWSELRASAGGDKAECSLSRGPLMTDSHALIGLSLLGQFQSL